MSEKPKTLGLVTAFTPEIFKSEYFTRIISGIIDALSDIRYDLRFIMVKEDEDPRKPKDILSEHHVDGLMFLTWRIHPKFVEEALTGFSDLPVVLINDYVPEVKTSIVYCNNRIGARKAMYHLISRGFKRIGMIQGPDDVSLDAAERYQIYREMLEEAHIKFNPDYFRKCDYFFEEDGYLKMLDMIQNVKPLPQAILCFNDDLAIGAIRALKEEKIRVPGQVAIMGYDGIERGKYVDPPLTSVRQPLEAMGREMVRICVNVLEGLQKPPIKKEFQPEIMIRRSV
ncbi:MAG: hypothetical protein COV74_00100 [Candidatus Omnitrophica bacterium CG11_big_fil_rev_8_21_14_0_20_45_26]|uniref:Transcriptional regulator LacI/GalR-like sensor domain-containing protein n=1 Tax=Candidatus Abzuiibacterium crystallinum TaxID=1974748 RepID=A0A2H0LTA4_9BACT|nr:MAG: hypothetical protein COV74_00100 [Candidatus Omnitrophica bacterium CG11_big_fil_rev_8_21_14_0_20_45_26]PIW65732.1 MAG: hypothetical protein COW12_00490 [Candidatus Omnitrophica bacterium CG12_big_fil_rev_8_21_14_0_65_45_16]